MERKMKRSCLNILMIALILLPAFPVKTQESVLRDNRDRSTVRQNFDASKNETTVYVTTGLFYLMFFDFSGVSIEPRAKIVKLTLLDSYYSFLGKSPARPPTVSFTFISMETKAKYEEANGFSIDLENKQSFQGKFQYRKREGEILNRKLVEEVLKVTVPIDTFLQIAQAKTVGFNFGSRSYKLSRIERKSLENLSASVK